MFKLTLTALVFALSVTATAADLKTDLLSEDLNSEVSLKKIEGIQDFTFYNKSSISICILNVSPSYSDNWEENILGRTIYSGDSIKVTMNGYDNHCDFDVRAVACSGAKVTARLNLCSVGSWTVY